LVVGVRESGLGNRLRESKMMQSRRPRIQTRGDVAQSLAPGQLPRFFALPRLIAVNKTSKKHRDSV